MKIELNLWLGTKSINGRVNINRDEYCYRFNELYDYNRFVEIGILKSIATAEEFDVLTENLNLDTDAYYAWFDQSSFLFWNKKSTKAYIFHNEMFELALNRAYQKQFKRQPDVTFKLVKL